MSANEGIPHSDKGLVNKDPMGESICFKEKVMINFLDESYIEKKVRSRFTKAKNMVEEMIRRVEGEINGDNCFDILKKPQASDDQVPFYKTDERSNELPWESHQQKECCQPIEIFEDQKEKVNKIEDVSMFSFSCVDERCESDEKNVDDFSKCFPENYSKADGLFENGIFDAMEERNSDDFFLHYD